MHWCLQHIQFVFFSDVQVEQKRMWNDKMKIVAERSSDNTRTILSGKRWYEIQVGGTDMNVFQRRWVP